MNIPEITLRAVEPSDAALLFDSENDIDAWPDSDTVAPYSAELLFRYAGSYRADPFGERQLRLIAEDYEGNAVGILDFYDISAVHRRAMTGIYTVPAFRRRGFGRAMLSAGKEYASKVLNLVFLGAKILADNMPSHRLFIRCGYSNIATLPKWHFAAGRYHDVNVYMLRLDQ